MPTNPCPATCSANGRRCSHAAEHPGNHNFIDTSASPAAGALERQALANVLSAIDDATAELAEASQDAIDKYLASTDRTPTWAEVEKFDQLRTALERAISAANTILA